jgi:sentrin-specific protease 1
MDKIHVPINLGNAHWVLAVIYLKKKKIEYFDSCRFSHQENTQKEKRVAKAKDSAAELHCLQLKNYLMDMAVFQNRTTTTFEWDSWKLLACDRATPQQKNSNDCGVFVCLYAHFISSSQVLSFSQENMSDGRLYIASKILKGSILNKTL